MVDCADLEHFHHCRFTGQCWSFYSTPCTPNLKVLTAPRPSRNAGQRWSGNECLISEEGSERLAREGHTVFIQESRFLLPVQPVPAPQSQRRAGSRGGCGGPGPAEAGMAAGGGGGGLWTAVSERGGVRVSKQPEAGILTQGPTL